MLKGQYTVKVSIDSKIFCLHSIQKAWLNDKKAMEELNVRHIRLAYVELDLSSIGIGHGYLLYNYPMDKDWAQSVDDAFNEFLSHFKIDTKGRLIRDILTAIQSQHAGDRYKLLMEDAVHWKDLPLEWWYNQDDEKIINMFTSFTVAQYKQR